MPRLLSTVSHVAQARLHQISRRAALRASLGGVAVLAALIALGYVLAAITLALARRHGTMEALAIMAIAAVVVVLVMLFALWLEARRHRRLAVRRAALDRELYRAAALSVIPDRAPARSTVGLGLVALGAALVLFRRRG